MTTTEDSSDRRDSKKTDVQGDEMWIYDMFGCFSDWRLCITSFLCPCYTLGKNAEALGEDCLTVGGLSTVGCYFGFGPLMRWRIRQKKNIRGSMLGDVMAYFLCPICSMIQENREMYGINGSHIGEKTPLTSSIPRE